MRTYLHERVLSVTQGQYRDRDRCHTEVGLHEDAAMRLCHLRALSVARFAASEDYIAPFPVE